MTELFSHGHFVDHVSGSLQKFFNDFLILKHRGRESVGTPFGLNSTVLDDRSGLRENAFNQFGSYIQSLSASSDAIRSKSVDSSFVLRSKIHGRTSVVGDGVAANRDDGVGEFSAINGRPGLKCGIVLGTVVLVGKLVILSIGHLGKTKDNKSSKLEWLKQ